MFSGTSNPRPRIVIFTKREKGRKSVDGAVISLPIRFWELRFQPVPLEIRAGTPTSGLPPARQHFMAGQKRGRRIESDWSAGKRTSNRPEVRRSGQPPAPASPWRRSLGTGQRGSRATRFSGAVCGGGGGDVRDDGRSPARFRRPLLLMRLASPPLPTPSTNTKRLEGWQESHVS